MTKQNSTINLLKRTLDELIRIGLKIENKEIKSIKFNGKIYKKINLSSYQVENAMYEYATLEERANGIIKANTITTKSPYKEILDNTKFQMAKDRGNNLLDSNNLEFADLKHRYGVLAEDFAKLKDRLKLYEKIIREHEINDKSINNSPLVAISNNLNDNDKTKEILAQLIELNSMEDLLFVDTLVGGNQEIWYEGEEINKKLCNLNDVRDIGIKLSENRKLIQKEVILFKD